MKLYSSKVPIIAGEVVDTLEKAGDIEVENSDEAKLDIEAVLKEFLRMDRELLDEAKRRLESRGLGHSQLGRAKSQIAKERGAPPPDETIPYLLGQILHILFHSPHFAEVYAEDVSLRTQITGILRRHLEADADLDKEVRARIKNLEEGTSAFEVEYSKVMEQIRRKHGLT